MEDRNPIIKIDKMLQKVELVGHKSRREFLFEMLKGMILARSVHFCEIAASVSLPAKVRSIERRIQRFFQEVSFVQVLSGRFLLSFVHHSKLVISIDRTNRCFGNLDINILCAAVSIGKSAVPICFRPY